MKNILWFDEVGKDDTAVVGGKGANLGELTRAGFDVPEGFIVTAQAYFDFIEETGLKEKIKQILEGFDPENSEDLRLRAVRIQEEIKKADFPGDLAKEIIASYHQLAERTGIPVEKLFVAVRSSATAEDLADASFAGQQATFLEIKGDIKVLSAVLKCWASLFEARAIYYRNDKGFDQLEVGIAVPVQRMIESEKAGVMFTIDPTDNDLDHISIEAAYGWGEVVVLGAVTPDRYLVNKKTLEITDKDIHKQEWKVDNTSGPSDTTGSEGIEKTGVKVPEDLQEKQKLSDEEIIQLAQVGLKIEAHYGAPQDTEWAIEKNRVYMVQSRPITTLAAQSERGAKEEKTQVSKNIILKGSGASAGIASGIVKIIHSPTEIGEIKKGDVLVTEMTTPDFVPAMKRAVAIVTDEGGRTCHAAIVSRELGIPCVVGTKKATEVLQKYPEITVDGKNGFIYEGIAEAKETAKAQEQSVPSCSGELITATKIYVNLAEPQLAEKMAMEDVDGVGLLRAEFIIMESIGEHPKKMIKEGRQEEYISKLQEGMESFAAAFNPRPVIYRATDFKTNEYRGLKGGEEFEPQESNPMIGYRGCFRYLKDQEEFKLELEALKRVRENYKNLFLMIPFVRRVDEFMKVKEIIQSYGLNKEIDPDFKLWIMVEVPSAVIEIEKYCKLGIDGVSIGSNDLTQLVLGLDRDSSLVAEQFDERHEAVLEMIKKTVETCKEHGVTCSICGQAPSVYPEITQKLVEYGITSISVNPDMIETSRKVIATVEERLLLNELSEVRKRLAELELKIGGESKNELS